MQDVHLQCPVERADSASVEELTLYLHDRIQDVLVALARNHNLREGELLRLPSGKFSTERSIAKSLDPRRFCWGPCRLRHGRLDHDFDECGLDLVRRDRDLNHLHLRVDTESRWNLQVAGRKQESIR